MLAADTLDTADTPFDLLSHLLQASLPPLTPDPLRTERWELTQVVGADLHEVCYVEPGQDLRLGSSPGAIFLPDSLLPSPDFPLLAKRGDTWVLQRAAEWAGFVEVNGARTPLALLPGARAQDGIVTHALTPDSRVWLDLGCTWFLIQPAPAARALPWSIPAVDTALLGSVGAIAFLATLLGAFGLQLPPPTHADTSHALLDTLVTLQRPTTPPPPARATPSPTQATKGGSPSHARGGKRDEGAAPRSKSPGTPSMGGLLAALDNGALATIGSGMSTGLSDAVRVLGGRPTYAGVGLGTRGPGFGSGGSTVTGLGDGGGAPGRRPGYGKEAGDGFGEKSGGAIRASVGEPLLIGNLDRAMVDAVIKKNMASLRYCYQRELQRTPDLAGKVTVKFIIAKDGSVSSANIKSSTMGSSAVEACLANRFLRFNFPEPKGGGIAIVSYPLLFSPG